jgi:Spy/CpxP family protein refolding chaperone
MKTAYELAMERLQKTAPTVKLTKDQKQQMAEIESKYAAKMAERELFLKGEIVKAVDGGDEEAVAQLEKQLSSERRALKSEMEEKKEQVRAGSNP